MKKFTDCAGRSWVVAINVDAIKRVRAAGVDLMSIIEADGKLIGQLTTDPVILVDVIYLVCKPQADSLKVTDEDFGRAMAGDALDGATDALLEELIAFFPKGRRTILTKVLAKVRAAETSATLRAAVQVDAIDVEALLDRLQQPASGGSVGRLPGSAESTPAP
jgi:hypothetical protein